jgi:hypothetical protein
LFATHFNGSLTKDVKRRSKPVKRRSAGCAARATG